MVGTQLAPSSRSSGLSTMAAEAPLPTHDRQDGDFDRRQSRQGHGGLMSDRGSKVVEGQPHANPLGEEAQGQAHRPNGGLNADRAETTRSAPKTEQHDAISATAPKVSARTANASPMPGHRTTSPARSSTPAPLLPNGTAASSSSTTHAEAANRLSPLDAAEEQIFRLHASPSSSTVLPPPPMLPYDLSYPPFSPLGVDQIGRSIAQQYPGQSARANANVPQFGAPPGLIDAQTSTSSSGGQDGPLTSRTAAVAAIRSSAFASGTNGQASTSTSTGHHPTAIRHSNHHERPKKALRGQELEQHMVSEAPGQRPMPWGLQSVLIDKAQGEATQQQPGRTRMGTLKRNATNSNARQRNGSGKTAMQTASPAPPNMHLTTTADDESASEFGASPRPHTLEVKPENDDTQPLAIREGGTPTMQMDVSPVPSGLAAADDDDAVLANGIPASHEEAAAMTNGDDTLVEEAAARTAEASNADLTTCASSTQTAAPLSQQTQATQPTTTPTNGQRSRKSQRRRDSVPAASSDPPPPLPASHDDAADASLDDDSTASSSTRRPRAAHKRLKLIGGYYGKAAPGAEAKAEEEDATTTTTTTTTKLLKHEDDDSVGPSAARTSRAASSNADAAPQLPSGGVGPSTPSKGSQQLPTLSIGLRNSASKVLSSKKVHAAAGGGAGSAIAAASSAFEETDGNNEYCETCRGVGHFICCDGCPRSFHFACINPPLDIDELPDRMGGAEDKWFCSVCRAQQAAKVTTTTTKRKGGKRPALFDPLLQHVEGENPSIFSLPHDIRNYFKGVATANDGAYVDSTMLRPLRINKLGLVDERDPLRLKDKNGKLILCYRCGGSSLPRPPIEAPVIKRTAPRRSSPRKSRSTDAASVIFDAEADTKRVGWRKMIGCDFCSLHWHLDCLDPPLTTMPSLSRKWMCPNHVDHVIRSERIPKNVANSTSIHDLPLPSSRSIGPGKHYRFRVVNDGQIDIIPDPMDTYFGGHAQSSGGVGVGGGASGSSNGGAAGKEDVHRATDLSSTVSGPAENRGRGLDKGWEGQGGRTQQIKFKYRLPEKVIRLDFWSRAEMERERVLARWMRRANEQAAAAAAGGSGLDLLAQAADAALLAYAAKSGDGGARDPASTPLTDEEATALVEQVFGAQALLPIKAPLEDDDDDDDARPTTSSSDEATWLDSSLRRTYEDGVYEREFDQRAAAMISPATTLPPAEPTQLTPAMRAAKHAAELDNGAPALDVVEADELKQLRAVKALLDRRGAKRVIDFLLDDRSAAA